MPFLYIWGLYTLALGVLVLRTEKLELHRAMHPVSSPFLDRSMALFTHLADGMVPTAVALMMLLIRDLRSFLMIGLSCGGSAIIVQVLKRSFSHDRPSMYRAELGDMHWVSGIDLHHHLSFPSGHATAAFSMCLALAVLSRRRAWGYALGSLAAILAYTRVYLSQHFTEDILVGAAIGTVTALVVYQWLYRSAFSERSFLDRRLFT